MTQVEVAADDPGLHEPVQADRLVHGRADGAGRRDADGWSSGRTPAAAGAGSSPRRSRSGSSRSRRSGRCSTTGSSSSRSAAAGSRSCATRRAASAVSPPSSTRTTRRRCWRRRSRGRVRHQHLDRAGRARLGPPDPALVDRLTVAEARAYLAEGTHFAPGAMAPKIEACIGFLERGGGEAVISSPENLELALAREGGHAHRPVLSRRRPGRPSRRSPPEVPDGEAGGSVRTWRCVRAPRWMRSA